MQSNPTISVVMPAHAEVKYIEEAVKSILEQSWVDFELIIVNDRLSQEATRRVEKIVASDNRIKFFKSDGTGISSALNKGVSLSRGNYIARMDSDDISEKYRLEKQILFMHSHPEVGILGTQIIYINHDGIQKGQSSFPTRHKEIARSLTFYNCIAHPTVMIRKTVIDSIGPYDSRFDGSEDYELWNRAIQETSIRNLGMPLLQYRESESQITKSHTRIPERQEKTILWNRLFSELSSEDNLKSIRSRVEQTHSTLLLREVYHSQNRNVLLKDLIKKILRGHILISQNSFSLAIKITSRRLAIRLKNRIAEKL